MTCPQCKVGKLKLVRAFEKISYVRRTRQCDRCGRRLSTREYWWKELRGPRGETDEIPVRPINVGMGW